MQAIERSLLDLSVLSVILLCGVIVVDIILRTLAGSGLPHAMMLMRDLTIAAIILPLSAATAARAHIAVTVLTDQFMPIWRGRLILLGHAVALIALIPLLYALGRMALAGWNSGLSQDGPGLPGLLLSGAGLALMWVRLWIMLVDDARSLRETGVVIDDHGQEAI